MNRLNLTISGKYFMSYSNKNVYAIKSKKFSCQLLNRALSSSSINHSPSHFGPIDFPTNTHYSFGIFHLLIPFHCIFLFQSKHTICHYSQKPCFSPSTSHYTYLVFLFLPQLPWYFNCTYYRELRMADEVTYYQDLALSPPLLPRSSHLHSCWMYCLKTAHRWAPPAPSST